MDQESQPCVVAWIPPVDVDHNRKGTFLNIDGVYREVSYLIVWPNGVERDGIYKLKKAFWRWQSACLEKNERVGRISCCAVLSTGTIVEQVTYDDGISLYAHVRFFLIVNCP